MTFSYLFEEELNQVLVEQNKCAGKVVLNRPRKLNSLTYHMISQILKSLKAYEKDPNIKVVILKGNGKAFSAGGDAVALIHIVISGFYKKQLILDYVIGTYEKPLVSFINGIVMGGGAGLSMHGRFRVVTENAVFAMPEVLLGLFPDVGASHFLSRLPGCFGEYLGLTGTRLDGAEMLACSLATHLVLSKDLPLLENALYELDSSDPAVVSKVINGFAQRASVKEKSACNRLEIIDKCFSRKTVEEILIALENEVVNGREKWIPAAINSMKKASPTSLKIFLRSVREGRMQNLEQCLIRECRIAGHLIRRTVNKDFFEGCRAIFLDKDGKPKWEPSKLELVSSEMVDQFFRKVDDEGGEDLILPARSNLSSTSRAKL